MSDSETESSEYDYFYERNGYFGGNNSIADATDGSQSDSDSNSDSSDTSSGSVGSVRSDDSQSISTRSSSSYQTDVTESSSGLSIRSEDGNESVASSAESFVSDAMDSEGEYTPVDASSGDESNDGAPLHEYQVEPEGPADDVGRGDAPVEELIPPEPPGSDHDDSVVEIPADAPAEPPPQPEPQIPPEDPQPGPSNETDKSKTAKKRLASEMDSDSDLDDDQRCPICFDGWKGTGDHRIVSLKCGHLFGKSCVEKWVKKNKKCPKCNQPNKMQDVRPIFAPTIKVKETESEEALKVQLNQAYEKQRELELKLLRMEQEKRDAEHKLAAEQEKNQKNVQPQPERRQFDWKYTFKVVKDNVLTQGGGRVMAFCPWETQLTLSKASTLTGFGLRMFNCEREFLVQNIDSFHTQPIRDIAYCPNRSSSILVTTSLDKSTKMIDYRCNSVVQTFRMQQPGWSCCWDSTGLSEDIHKISVGMVNGEIARYDVRFPAPEPYMVLGKKVFGSGQDITAVTSLVSVPRGFCQSLPRGALLACHLKSCQIFVGDEDATGTKLPYEGSFSCIRCEPVTGHLLLSTKRNTHMVLKLLDGVNRDPANLLEPVLEVTGRAQMQTVLTRSAVATYTSHGESKLMVAASEEKVVKMWSVSEGGKLVSSLNMPEVVMDICNLSFNHKDYFAFLSDKKVSIYQMVVR